MALQSYPQGANTPLLQTGNNPCHLACCKLQNILACYEHCNIYTACCQFLSTSEGKATQWACCALASSVSLRALFHSSPTCHIVHSAETSVSGWCLRSLCPALGWQRGQVMLCKLVRMLRLQAYTIDTMYSYISEGCNIPFHGLSTRTCVL